jgi:hypothetical protein
LHHANRFVVVSGEPLVVRSTVSGRKCAVL